MYTKQHVPLSQSVFAMGSVKRREDRLIDSPVLYFYLSRMAGVCEGNGAERIVILSPMVLVVNETFCA